MSTDKTIYDNASSNDSIALTDPLAQTAHSTHGAVDESPNSASTLSERLPWGHELSKTPTPDTSLPSYSNIFDSESNAEHRENTPAFAQTDGTKIHEDPASFSVTDAEGNIQEEPVQYENILEAAVIISGSSIPSNNEALDSRTDSASHIPDNDHSSEVLFPSPVHGYTDDAPSLNTLHHNTSLDISLSSNHNDLRSLSAKDGPIVHENTPSAEPMPPTSPVRAETTADLYVFPALFAGSSTPESTASPNPSQPRTEAPIQPVLQIDNAAHEAQISEDPLPGAPLHPTTLQLTETLEGSAESSSVDRPDASIDQISLAHAEMPASCNEASDTEHEKNYELPFEAPMQVSPSVPAAEVGSDDAADAPEVNHSASKINDNYEFEGDTDPELDISQAAPAQSDDPACPDLQDSDLPASSSLPPSSSPARIFSSSQDLASSQSSLPMTSSPFKDIKDAEVVAEGEEDVPMNSSPPFETGADSGPTTATASQHESQCGFEPETIEAPRSFPALDTRAIVPDSERMNTDTNDELDAEPWTLLSPPADLMEVDVPELKPSRPVASSDLSSPPALAPVSPPPPSFKNLVKESSPTVLLSKSPGIIDPLKATETGEDAMSTSIDADAGSSKHPREEEEIDIASKRTKKEDSASPVLPVPKRSTFASQNLLRQKFAAPFRSPIMKKAPEPENKSKPEPAADALLRAKTPDPDPAPLPPKKKFTPKAASQFKSPFSSSPSPALSAVRLTPTIQTLERRIQVLKRAVKVQQDGEAGTLEGLVRKWTEAGREVAWEVWEAVKDNSEGDGKGAGGKGGWGSDDKKGGWGYDEKPGEEGGWGAEEDYKGKPRAHEEEEEEKTTDTLGTMLRQLGIAPETLGWDEDEGEFVDV